LVCHNLSDFQRDFGFEQRLNTKRFQYHWIIDGQLAAMAGGKIYVWSGEKWTTLKTKFPLKRQPKLFEDDDFIAFGDCYGEWGGTIYFFEKASGSIYFTESTCTNSVSKEKGKYLILSHLGHMTGSSEIKLVENPRNLTKAKKSEINKTKGGQALGYADQSGAFEKILGFYWIQIFSGFRYNNRQLYLIYLNDLTFLAEIHGTEIEIVHPLFYDKIYTHNPVTTTYSNHTLINFDFYGTALDREVSVMIVSRGKITKLDWNENHSR
jgi:hypothetical protein